MFFYEGQSCPVCGHTFAPQDDIVTCPQCGAPHHRACWQQEGHCHFAADHGTDRQWQRTAAEEPAGEPDAEEASAAQDIRTCPHCGAANKEFAEFCSHCGQPLPGNDWQTRQEQPDPMYGSYSPFAGAAFDPMGGVPPTQPIEDTTAAQLQPLIGINSQYYLPRFVRISGGRSRASWNWAAFLLPFSWLFYRKNLTAGIATLFISICESLGNAILIDRILGNPQTYEQLYQALLGAATGSDAVFLGLIYGIIFLNFGVRILCGLFGNRIYLDTLLRKARRQRENPENFPPVTSLRGGGISLLLGAGSYFLMWLLDMLITL